MNKQRKVLAGLLGVGVLALGADRLLLESPTTGPQSARAGATAMASSAAEEAARASVAEPSQVLLDKADAGPRLADRLLEVAQQQALPPQPQRDAFALGSAWAAAVDTQPAAPARAAELERFATQHRLMAIMTPGERGVAVIDGKPLRVGSTFDGFTLTAVEGHQAIFKSPAGEVTLHLNPRR